MVFCQKQSSVTCWVLTCHLKLISCHLLRLLQNLPNLNSCDLDENIVQTINSKYYKIQELAKINTKNQLQNFSLFNVNIRSLAKHIDELLTLLYSTKIPFDVIGLTESKQSSVKDFLTNVDINVYQLHTQPTKSSCGGVALFVKKSLNHKVLHNLNALENEFETLWIEISTGTKRKNIVCCAYKHPDTDVRKFIEYLESTLSKIDKNKTVQWVISILTFSTMSRTVTPMNLSTLWYHIIFFLIFSNQQELLIILQQ